MKKTFLSIALILAAGISTFANDNDGISKSVKSSFSKDFKSATNVQWQQKSKFDKATFSLNNQSTYGDYWISDLFENAAHDATTYYVTLENADQKLILQSTNSNEWSVYQRTAKNVE
jgi:hypothetical protein